MFQHDYNVYFYIILCYYHLIQVAIIKLNASTDSMHLTRTRNLSIHIVFSFLHYGIFSHNNDGLIKWITEQIY